VSLANPFSGRLQFGARRAVASAGISSGPGCVVQLFQVRTSVIGYMFMAPMQAPQVLCLLHFST
jgi:hypothetical protein